MNEEFTTEVLIVGSGIAGTTAALELARLGVPVTLVTRAEQPEESNTRYAQGGIIYRGTEDSAAMLMKDIMQAGAEYNNREAVDILAAEGPELVRRILIDRLQVPFERRENGALSLIREGAHSVDRILHVADYTGRAIATALLNAVRETAGVRILTGHTAIDLITTSHHSNDRQARYGRRSCAGVYCYDQAQGTVRRILARAVILATGGVGQLFLRTSNPAGARGDGLAMAYRAGGRVLNCEFVQFHPTTFYHPHAKNFLISEAVRGAGGRLVDEHGQPFMHKYSPEWRDLAPRDITARGIHQEMLQRGTTNMYLDVTGIGSADEIRRRFPDIQQFCRQYKIDIATDPIPVVPAAHYFCGGIWVDTVGRTTIDNLFAAGEVACSGVHGANRIASSALLEGLVWGSRVAQQIGATLTSLPLPSADDYPEWQYTGDQLPDKALIQQDMENIRQLMWNYVGLVRTTHRLERALQELNHLNNQVESFYRHSRVTDELIGLRNMVLSALLITRAAHANRSSIGCHYRE